VRNVPSWSDTVAERRPFPPSPRRLALARASGLSAASPLVVGAVASLAALAVVFALGRAVATRLGTTVVAAMNAADGRGAADATRDTRGSQWMPDVGHERDAATHSTHVGVRDSASPDVSAETRRQHDRDARDPGAARDAARHSTHVGVRDSASSDVSAETRRQHDRDARDLGAARDAATTSTHVGVRDSASSDVSAETRGQHDRDARDPGAAHNAARHSTHVGVRDSASLDVSAETRGQHDRDARDQGAARDAATPSTHVGHARDAAAPSTHVGVRDSASPDVSAETSTDAVMRAVAGIPARLLELLLPLLVAAALAALVAHVAQTRSLWFPRRRLPGAPAMPRRARAGFELVAAGTIGTVAFAWLWLCAPRLALLVHVPSAAAPAIASFVVTLAAAWVALGAIDSLLRRRMLADALAMTREEKREDERLTAADPRWAAQRLSAARGPAVGDAVARSAIVVVGDDVAVAIEWDPVRQPVPLRVATGRGPRATQVMALARRQRVAIHRDVELAAALVSAEGPVPERDWARLAELVAATRGRVR
jgi:flagellar biosynthesis protein FlhB